MARRRFREADRYPELNGGIHQFDECVAKAGPAAHRLCDVRFSTRQRANDPVSIRKNVRDSDLRRSYEYLLCATALPAILTGFAATPAHAATGDAFSTETLQLLASGGLCVAGLGFLFFGWTRYSASQAAYAKADADQIARRKYEEALGAVLLDRADGAAIWEGTELQAGVGAARELVTITDASNPERVAEALVRSDEVPPLAQAIGQLFDEGLAFELSLSSPEDKRRRICGNALGTRLLLTITDAHTLDSDPPRVEDELTGARRRIQLLEECFAASPLLAWQRDSLGKLSWVNRRYVETVEAPGIGATLDCQIELIPGKNGKKLAEMAEAARTSGVAVTERHDVIFHGEKRTLEITETPLEHGTFGAALDITDQASMTDQMVSQIRANEETLDRLQRGVAVFDENHRLTFFNKAIAEFWALDPEWLSARPSLRDLLNALREARRVPTSKDFRAWRDTTEELFDKLDAPVERDWHLPGGEVFNVLIQPHALGGTLCVFEDASNFHALKRDAATASAVYKTAFSRLGEGVAVFALDGKCRLANDAMLEMWNLDPEHAELAHIREIAARCRGQLHDESVWDKIITHVSAATEAREVWTENLHRLDGTVVQMSTAPLPDGAMLFAFRDITDSHNRQRALADQNEQLEEISRLKSQFLRSIHSASHELKIPLNTIVGFSEILAQEMYGELNTRQHEYVDGVYQASHQLRQLIGGIIDLAMLQADYFAFRVESIDIRKILDSAVTFVARNASEKLEYRITCPQDIGEIPGDAPRFREIIHTLLSAMQKELPSGEAIEVGAERQHGYVRLWVGATQNEVPEAVRDVFIGERIGEAMPVLRRTALGMTLVRQFVERQGGSIGIELGVGGTREAVVYHLLTDADEVRAAINGAPSMLSRSAAE